MNFRIGFGYDIHQLAEGEDLWLGGIKLDYYLGTVGHSDADVLIHAICDAILGAANLRDIGFHFPDTDPKYKGADSKVLLKEVGDILNKNGYRLGNIDATIVLEQPKINPHIEKMQETMAPLLSVSTNDISIKATTSEKLSFVGREEGVKAYAVALVYKSEA
ncbi:MAG: 2-C-methyl-D-erythritol 2,4-cyclodiphosphate synthase [Salibacteraceae bacterium]|jgi:2-C-methyl-D-erythritol 2,4-cyclodiphosphate synthase|tara:strand:- start:5861 stop:6346 length:486 start_codon:yes stop_codon:yes gene_type:complete